MTPETDSPTGLDMHPRPPEAVRVRKAVGVAAIIFAGMVAFAIVYGVYERQHRQVHASTIADVERKATPATTASQEFIAGIPIGEGPAPKQDAPSLNEEAQAGAVDESPSPTQRLPGRPESRSAGQPIALRYQNSAVSLEDGEREIADRKEQEAMEAPTSIGGGGRGYGGNSNTYAITGSPSTNSIPQAFNASGGGVTVAAIPGGESKVGFAGTSPAAEYNAQNAQDEKTSFIARARNRLSDDDLHSIRTAPLSKFEIKAGWDIPATLEQGINSDQPGEIKALVRENVYDTATGRFVLIPQGSRLVGSYNSAVSYSQDGVQVVWNRVVFPDASSIDLNGMIGQDAAGEAGLRYAVDHHYARLIGFAVLTSLFSAGFQLSQNRPGTILTQPSAGEVVAGAVGGQVSQLGAEITRRNLNVQPTIKVPAGYRFNVRVNRDMVFDAPYGPLR
jgi:type IV secretory pathway VirB10-like protein